METTVIRLRLVYHNQGAKSIIISWHKDFFEQIDDCNIDLDGVKKLLNEDAFDKQEVEVLLNSISPDAVDEKVVFDSESNKDITEKYIVGYVKKKV